MAAFSSKNFAYNSYATNRPDYPPSLYNLVLAYHQGSHDSLLDLGCGHGTATRALASKFKHGTGADPSAGMLEQAERIAQNAGYDNIRWVQGTAESVPSVGDSSVDLVIAGQAAHWFPYPPQRPNVWNELGRVVKPGGTVAFWGYADGIFPESAWASDVLHRWAYGEGDRERGRPGMGPFWSFPGRARIETLYGNLMVPTEPWGHIKWIRHDNRKSCSFYDDVQAVCGKLEGNDREANATAQDQASIKLQKKMQVKQLKEHIRTWSAYHNWKGDNADKVQRSEDGSGDVVDWMIDEIAEREHSWKDEHAEILLEWPTGILLVRRNSI